MQNIYLTPHFTLREMCESRLAEKHDIQNVPSEQEAENLRRLCEGTLEPLREKLGLPVIITSGYRTKSLNDIIAHSARKSQHMEGRAADFYISPSGVSGSKFQVSGSRFQVSGSRSQVSGSKCQDSGSKCQVSGDLNHETGNSPMKLETPRQRLIRAFRLILQDPEIDFDQLILYPTFIHVSYVSRERNRRKITTANGHGTFCAINREAALSLI